MKNVLPALTLLSLLATSCSKSDDSTPQVKHNTWKLGTTTYTVNNYATNTTDDFQAYDKLGNGLNFSFASYPPADGNYRVVDRTASLGPNEMKVLAFGSASGSSYFATGSDNTVAVVKVLGTSRVSISLPDTWVVKGGTDSLKLSVDIGEF